MKNRYFTQWFHFFLLGASLSIGFLLSACEAEPGSESVTLDTAESRVASISKSDVPEGIATEQSEAQAKHTVWKIQGEQNTVYLIGSIHMLPAELYPLPAVYETAYADAENLVFEIDAQILDQQVAQQAVMQYATLPAGQRLEAVIGVEDYAEIKALAKDNKVPMFMIDPFDPWFSSLTLVSMQYLNAGLSPEHGIDQHFMQRGLKAGKPISGLETIQEQFAMFDSISLDIQAEMLIETLKQEVDVRDFIDRMIVEWQEGDLLALENLLNEEFEKYPEMYDVLLVNRNKNWIPQILPMLSAADDYLVVVGAAHMLGEQSVVRLLEAEGYSVEQL